MTYFLDAMSYINNEIVGISIAGLQDAHDTWAAQSPLLRDVGFEVEVVGSRHILVFHARVKVRQVFSIPTSTGGSDSIVHIESAGNLRLKADIHNVLRAVSGLWPRTGVVHPF